ncbi:hypothetical protein [Sporosarcina aquimarina]|uniref:hypothetical protein n=1 Tax=Sporosarcina aquimarina TaxID=114975 RepID=UPI001C8DE20F|nr:hypothetical protein [Sporosarcina aquimarina]MBY0221969.1 hypothetical protein [Sporosarcina aquimarina]
MEKNLKHVASLAFTILMQREVVTKEEIENASVWGYDGMLELLNEKYQEYEKEHNQDDL